MKKIYVNLFLLVASTVFAQIPTTGLISQWPFSGNANDIIGGNNGTVSGASLTSDRFGNNNCAYSFNGINNVITMLSAGPTGSVSRSVSFWERSTTTTGPRSAFSYGAAGGGGIFQVNFNYNCQAVGFDNSNSAVMHGNGIVNNGQWHHIVAVHDATVGITTGSVKIYIDGVLQPSVTCNVSGTTSPINSNSGLPIRIGLDVPSGNRYFNGDLDDFFLYNRALTPAEVLQLYNDVSCTGTPTSPNSLAGPNSICAGATVIYTATPVAGATSYSWSLPSGWTGTSTTNTISVVAGSLSGQIAVAAGNCCGLSQPVTTDITVNPSPTISITSTQLTICKGNSTTLTGSGASTYTWNSTIISPSITVSPTITTNYTLAGTNSVGCSTTAVTTVSVTNNVLPTIAVSGPTLICNGQTANIASNGASTYTWQPGNLNGFLIAVTPSVTTTYTVTGTDGNGCYNSSTYIQNVSACTGINEHNSFDDFVMYPNPFKNTFYIKVKNDKSIFEVYNSIGKLVYNSNLTIGMNEIDLSDKSSGIYFMRMITEKSVVTKRIVKQ